MNYFLIFRLNMSSTVFESDINFCPRCGSIMPLPGRDDVVTCMKCKFQVDITGIKIYYIDIYTTKHWKLSLTFHLYDTSILE